MSDSGSPPNRGGAAGSALPLVERAAEPALADLRSGYPAAAEVLARVLADGTLVTPLSPKPMGKLAGELLESLPGSAPEGGRAD